MLVKHSKSILNALCVVFMQRSVATPHNALSVRKRSYCQETGPIRYATRLVCHARLIPCKLHDEMVKVILREAFIPSSIQYITKASLRSFQRDIFYLMYFTYASYVSYGTGTVVGLNL